MRILVTGSRTWSDANAINTALDEILKAALAEGDHDVIVVHGCATGADSIADMWVRRRFKEYPVRAERHPAQWNKYGKRAGWVRNHRMVLLGADACLAFILNGSPGATHCADMAEAAGIRTERFTVRTSGPMPDEVA